jgi:hypothetical protein
MLFLAAHSKSPLAFILYDPPPQPNHKDFSLLLLAFAVFPSNLKKFHAMIETQFDKSITFESNDQGCVFPLFPVSSLQSPPSSTEVLKKNFCFCLLGLPSNFSKEERPDKSSDDAVHQAWKQRSHFLPLHQMPLHLLRYVAPHVSSIQSIAFF